MNSQIMSDGVYESRRSRILMMLSGCGSNARTNTYRLAASYATFASVRKRGSAPSVGCHCRNCVIGGACRHTASSSLPSIAGGVAARTATAPESVGAGTAYATPREDARLLASCEPAYDCATRANATPSAKRIIRVPSLLVGVPKRFGQCHWTGYRRIWL